MTPTPENTLRSQPRQIAPPAEPSGPDYAPYLVHYVSRSGVPFAPEPGRARLARIYREGRGWRPLVFWNRADAEAWLDERYPPWREFLAVTRITRAQYERLAETEGLIQTEGRTSLNPSGT